MGVRGLGIRLVRVGWVWCGLCGWRGFGRVGWIALWRGRVDLVWSLWAMAFEGKTGQVESLPSRRQLRPSPPSTQNPRLEAELGLCGAREQQFTR